MKAALRARERGGELVRWEDIKQKSVVSKSKNKRRSYDEESHL